MTWTSILLYVGAAAAGWALKHYYPALLGGPTPAPAATPPAVPAPIAAPGAPTSSPLADLLFQLVEGLVAAKSSSAQLPAVETQLASIVHGLLTPFVPATPAVAPPVPAVPK